MRPAEDDDDDDTSWADCIIPKSPAQLQTFHLSCCCISRPHRASPQPDNGVTIPRLTQDKGLSLCRGTVESTRIYLTRGQRPQPGHRETGAPSELGPQGAITPAVCFPWHEPQRRSLLCCIFYLVCLDPYCACYK